MATVPWQAEQRLAQMLTRHNTGGRLATDAQVHGKAMPIH